MGVPKSAHPQISNAPPNGQSSEVLLCYFDLAKYGQENERCIA